MPVLVSTHANGNPDPDFPSISQFNGVDVLVRDTALSYLVDCTQKHLSYRLPPYHALNSNAYVVDADMGGWIFIFDPRILMRTQVSIDAVMDTTGGLRGTAAITDIGFAKLATLEKAEKKENDASSDAPEDGPVSGLVVDTVATGTSAADTLVRKIGFHYLPSSTGNIYFVNPLLFFGFRKDPFRDSVRFSDVDFGSSQSFASRMRIKLAPNFSAEGLPETRTIQKDDSTISFTRKTFMEGNYLIIENAFVIKNAVYLREDYASLKSFFDKFYAFQNEDIPVKKDR